MNIHAESNEILDVFVVVCRKIISLSNCPLCLRIFTRLSLHMSRQMNHLLIHVESNLHCSTLWNYKKKISIVLHLTVFHPQFENLYNKNICLFGVFRFNSYGDVIIVGEGLQIFYLCSALMAIERWGFF